jgi:hypothetical protein
MLVTNFRLKYLLYRVVLAGYQLLDTAARPPARSSTSAGPIARRAEDRAAAYAEVARAKLGAMRNISAANKIRS